MKIAPRNHGSHGAVSVCCAWCERRFKASTRRSPRPRFCSYRCGSLARWNVKRCSDLEVLLAKAELRDGCLVWTGLKHASGYGIASFHGKRMLAHRAVWLANGNALARDKELCHRCNNKLCVNPNHIYQGTHADNMSDHARSGKATNQNVGKTHCPKGHPYDSANTRIVSGRRGRSGRQCKACAVARVKHHRALARLEKVSGRKP